MCDVLMVLKKISRQGAAGRRIEPRVDGLYLSMHLGSSRHTKHVFRKSFNDNHRGKLCFSQFSTNIETSLAASDLLVVFSQLNSMHTIVTY